MSWWEQFLRALGLRPTVERPSPSDIVMETGILGDNYAAKVIIDLRQLNIPFSRQPRIWIPPIPDTNSMDGAFDIGNNNILICGADPTNQTIMLDFMKVGDIAVYRTPTAYIIHRIIEIGTDGEGRYFIFKGDNNSGEDHGRIRDSQVEWLSIGIIY